MTCVKCGSGKNFMRIKADTIVWLCQKCYKKWYDICNKEFNNNDYEYDSTYKELWMENWKKFLSDSKEVVMFT